MIKYLYDAHAEIAWFKTTRTLMYLNLISSLYALSIFELKFDSRIVWYVY